MTKPPKIYISMPTYDLMHVSTCLSLVKLFNKFTIAKMPAEIGTFKCPLCWLWKKRIDCNVFRIRV